MLGVAQRVLQRPLPIPTPVLIGQWLFDETGGTTFADGVGVVDGTLIGAWDDLATGSLVEGVGGTSVFKTGTAHGILPAGQPTHDLLSLTLSVYYQPRTATSKHVILSRGSGTAPGDFSLERLPDGRLRGWHVGQDATLRFFENSSGITGTALLNGTAYRIDLTFGPAGAHLYLDGTALSAATIIENTNGWNNAAPLYVGVWNDGVGDPVDGSLDFLRVWQGQLSSNDIADLQPAQSTSLPQPSLGLLGHWPLSETSGVTFADVSASNNATLNVPGWAIATHEHNRPGIAAGTDHALEISNGGPSISMIAAYRQSAMSLVVYVQPFGELRGTQYWLESEVVAGEGDNGKWGREVIAFCDDGSTPGSFCIERRIVQSTYDRADESTWAWRLDGYVRNGAGTPVRFSGGNDGIASAPLPPFKAKRIVLTQGAGGATLWLDGSQVAHLSGVTSGWSLLTGAIYIGSTSDQGHANNRSPLWARVDEIEVWAGQLSSAEIQVRPAAVNTLPWRLPTDGSLINIDDHGGNIQACFDAAHAVGGYAYQARDPDDLDGDPWYTKPNGQEMDFRSNMRGIVGLRIRRGANESTAGSPNASTRILNMMVTAGGQMAGHNDRYAASGGYKLIGAEFDGNARNNNWSNVGTGTTFRHFDLQFKHAIMILSDVNTDLTVFADHCRFFDNCADGFSLSTRAKVTAKYTKFHGIFRGPFITNTDLMNSITGICYEGLDSGRLAGARDDNGTGLCDIEPFGGTPDTTTHFCKITLVDGWAMGDWDDQNQWRQGEPEESFSRYYNCHTTGAACALQMCDASGDRPIPDAQFWKCTMGYYRTGFGGQNFPLSILRGARSGLSGLGWLFDECVFCANWRPYVYHQPSGRFFPAGEGASGNCKLEYRTGVSPSSTGRLLTIRNNSRFQAIAPPANVPDANILAIQSQSMDTSRSVELTDLTISARFNDTPFNWGGATVRYRNVVHEGNLSDPTPWSGAGAEVAL